MVKDLQFRVVDAVGDVAGLSSLFLEAAATERKLPAVYRRGLKTAWPDYPDEGSAYGFTGEMTRLGPASAREVARYELAVELTGLLEPDESRQEDDESSDKHHPLKVRPFIPGRRGRRGSGA